MYVLHCAFPRVWLGYRYVTWCSEPILSKPIPAGKMSLLFETVYSKSCNVRV